MNAEDGVAGLAARWLAEQFEDLLQPFDMALGFVKVLLEAGLQFRRGRRLGHLRQGLHDLLFGVVDVLERIEKQVVQGLFGSHS